MKCRNPFVQGMHAYPCGQCMPCRVNRRRIWTHRIMLEAMEFTGNCFVTLTYSDDELKNCIGAAPHLLPSLMPKHLQDWLKRYRKVMYPQKIRFYAVGEYGDETGRPHYHLALFGANPCIFGRSRYSKVRSDCCVVCDTIRDTWGRGHIFVGELEAASAGYIAGYVIKKMTSPDDRRLLGRHPEFARMSRRPGIGAWAMDEVAHGLLNYSLDERLVDVPDSLRHGAKLLPLGRFLKRKLRERIGRDVQAPEEVLEAMAEEMRPLSRLHERYSTLFQTTFQHYTLHKEDVIKAGAQQAANLEAKQRIFKRRGTL